MVQSNEGENFWLVRTDLLPTKHETFERLHRERFWKEWDYGEDHPPRCEKDSDENVWVDCCVESDAGLCTFMVLFVFFKSKTVVLMG